jgi:ABC-2 type transport system permease protein
MGLMTFKRALPMPTGSYLAAKLLMAYVFAVIVMAMLVTLGVTVGHVTLPLVTLLKVAAVMSLGVIPACAVGLFIGAYAPASSASAFANIAYLSMAFLSGLFFPLTGFLHQIRAVWPTYHLSQLARASGGMPYEGQPMVHVAALVAMTAVLVALAGRKLARRG